MKKIIPIALLNLIQGTREKTFWLSGFFFVFLLIFSSFLGQLSIGEKEIILRSVMFSSIEISGLLLIVFGLVYSFYREKDSRLAEVYLSYFSPANYLTGKLLGFVSICFIYIFITSILGTAVFLLNKVFLWQLFLGSYGIFLKLSIFCCSCLLFSSMFSSPLFASIVTIFFYIGSELSYSASRIANIFENTAIKIFFKSIYYILPNVDKINLKNVVIYGNTPSLAHLINITLYTFFYCAFILLLTIFIFKRKEH